MSSSASQNDFVFYHYDPSLAAAIVFASMFGISTLLHLYQMLRTRTWYLIPFVIGGFCEIVGYSGRAISATQSPDWTLTPYIIQSLLLLIAPAFFAASIYMVLGRIILLTNGATYSLIRPKFLTLLFVSGDILCFLVQGSGAGLLATGEKQSTKTGAWIVVGGLILQVLFFGAFLGVASIFHRRMLASPTKHGACPDVPWRKHQLALYGASTMILVRNIVRVVEFIQGYNGWLLHREWPLYVFDGSLMLSAMILYNIVHPSEIKAIIQGGWHSVRGGLEMRYRSRVDEVEESDSGEKSLP